jgi:hypothetical protein
MNQREYNGHVVQKCKTWNMCIVPAKKRFVRRSLGKPRRRWKDIVKLYFIEIACMVKNWTELSQTEVDYSDWLWYKRAEPSSSVSRKLLFISVSGLLRRYRSRWEEINKMDLRELVLDSSGSRRLRIPPDMVGWSRPIGSPVARGTW